jgi:nicotinamidase-related amidase
MASCEHSHSLLLVVDLQNGFVSSATQHLVPRVKCLLSSAGSLPIAFTKFRNVDASPYVRFLGWKELMSEDECAIVPELAGYPGRVFEKGGYSGLTAELRRHLEEGGFETVYLCGIDTDCCVLATAVQLFERSIRPVVLADYCASKAEFLPIWQHSPF